MPKVKRVHLLALGADVLFGGQAERQLHPGLAPVAFVAQQLQIIRLVRSRFVQWCDVVNLIQMIYRCGASPAPPLRLRRDPPLQIPVDAALFKATIVWLHPKTKSALVADNCG
jgi:hypothetical protein